MKKIINTFVLVASICLFQFSCKKDEQHNKTELLTRGSWKLKAYTVTRLSDGLVTDAYAPISACYRDDQYIYKPDMSYEGNAGATKCAASDPQIFSMGTWHFKNNETTLERTITSGTGIGTIEFTVASVTVNELRLSVEDGGNRHDLRFEH